ncbi:MAG: hypothetical protein ABL933_15205 [Methyloglobulus sp.]|nr:hypothetical protein [Methyloglobulus sp.]
MVETAITNNLGSNIIYCNTKHKIWLAWFFAVFFNAMTLFAVIKGGSNILRAVQDNPVFYFFVLFPIIGVWVIVSAIRETLAWLKFGRIPLILETYPLQLNRPMQGYLTLPKKITQSPQTLLTLTCFHEYQDRSRRENQHRKEAIWQDSQTVAPELYGLETRVKFNFTAPANLPGSAKQGEDKYIWELHINMPLVGIDFDRTFEIPVVEAGNHGENEYKKIPNINHQLSQPENSRNKTSTIVNLPGSIQFHYGYGRSKGMAAALMVVALFIGGFSWLFFKGFDNFLPTTLMLVKCYVYLIAVLFFAFALFMVANRLDIDVGLDGIQKHQTIFGFALTENFPRNTIADITIEESGSSTSSNKTRVWYSLKLHTLDGNSLEVGDSLENYSHAQALFAKQ